MEEQKQPLVRIGVPVFNGERGLARALDSLAPFLVLGMHRPGVKLNSQQQQQQQQ